MDKLDLPQYLIILYLSFQKHKSWAWTRWIMHFQSLLVLHGLQEKSKGITPWPGRQGAVHQELLGAQRVVLNHSLGTALPNKPNSSPLTSAPACCHSSTFPPQEDAGKTATATTTGTLHPQIPRGGRARHNISPALLFLPQPPSSAIHYSSSGISPANLAKQKCCFFNTSRNQELSGEKLMINSPLLSAVVIYLQEWQGCCHVN